MMIDAAVRAALSAARAEAGGPAVREPKASLDERHFRRCDKLSGSIWKEFSFQFMTAARSANPKIRKVLEMIPKVGKDNDWELFFHDMDDWTDDEALKGGQEVNAAVAALVTGDAMTVVRSVTNGNGWAPQPIRPPHAGEGTHDDHGGAPNPKGQGQPGVAEHGP